MSKMSLETGRKDVSSRKDAKLRIDLFQTSTLKTALPSNSNLLEHSRHTHMLWSVSYKESIGSLIRNKLSHQNKDPCSQLL